MSIKYSDNRPKVSLPQLPSNIDPTKIGDGSLTATKVSYLSTVTADIQTQVTNASSTSSVKRNMLIYG